MDAVRPRRKRPGGADPTSRPWRSYSIASAPDDGYLVLTVQRLSGGAISVHVADQLAVGDQLELRGPIAEYFIWEQSMGGPLLLVGEGFGLVPFRAILRTMKLLRAVSPSGFSPQFAAWTTSSTGRSSNASRPLMSSTSVLR